MKIFLSIITTILLWTTITTARSYPVKIIYPNNCSVTDENCGYNLPIIENANYQNYRYNRNYRGVYTMLQGTTYYDGRDMGIGSHQGIDIASKSGTPIYATHDGIVILATEKGGRGNVITIKHNYNGQEIYSSYAHLQDIIINIGDSILEGQLIATMGNSGNSTGPHLHFQIEIKSNGEHPFFFKNCAGTIEEIVNEGRCQEQMYEHTIDPILFIESNGLLTTNSNEEIIINNNFHSSKLAFSGYIGGAISLNGVEEILLQTNLDDIVELPLKFKFNKNKLNITPNEVLMINNGRKLFITPKEEGFSSIKITHAAKTLTEIPVYITQENIEEPTQFINFNTFSIFITSLSNKKIIFAQRPQKSTKRFGFILENGKLSQLE